MKKNTGSLALPVVMLIMGIAAFQLRKQLYTAAVDVKGLLLRGHPFGLALAALTVAALLLAMAGALKQKLTCSYEQMYSRSLLAGCGKVAAAAGILVTVLSGTTGQGGNLEMIWRCLGLAAPVCLVLAGLARCFGRKPFFLLDVTVCLFFLVHMVLRYRFWSGNPQMQDYVFALLGAMALTLFCLYTAALEADLGSPRMLVGLGLCAVYLCLAELSRTSCPALYLGGAVWALTDLCSMRMKQESE